MAGNNTAAWRLLEDVQNNLSPDAVVALMMEASELDLSTHFGNLGDD